MQRQLQPDFYAWEEEWNSHINAIFNDVCALRAAGRAGVAWCERILAFCSVLDSRIGWIVWSVGSTNAQNVDDSGFNHAACRRLKILLPLCVNMVRTIALIVWWQCAVGEEKSLIEFVSPKSTQLLSPGEVGIRFRQHGRTL